MPSPTAEDPQSTRERILDVALGLFSEQGYDGTSMREIADHLGFTKAALYYHFRSKEDILLALHLRIHEVGRRGLARLAEGPVTLAAWQDLVEDLLGEMFAQRELFLMHQRNQAVLERVHHDKGHEAEHEDLQGRMMEMLSDPSLPARDRVRMACSFGALFAILFISAGAFEGIEDKDLELMVRDVVGDILEPRP